MLNRNQTIKMADFCQGVSQPPADVKIHPVVPRPEVSSHESNGGHVLKIKTFFLTRQTLDSQVSGALLLVNLQRSLLSSYENSRASGVLSAIRCSELPLLYHVTPPQSLSVRFSHSSSTTFPTFLELPVPPHLIT